MSAQQVNSTGGFVTPVHDRTSRRPCGHSLESRHTSEGCDTCNQKENTILTLFGNVLLNDCITQGCYMEITYLT